MVDRESVALIVTTPLSNSVHDITHVSKITINNRVDVLSGFGLVAGVCGGGEGRHSGHERRRRVGFMERAHQRACGSGARQRAHRTSSNG